MPPIGSHEALKRGLGNNEMAEVNCKLPKFREAEEIFLLMHRNCRVSRNIRANWFFDHLNKPVRLYSKKDTESQELLVYGMTAVGGHAEDIIGKEKLIVTKETRLTFVSRLYRHVYVLDLSPSTLVADDEAGCCIFTLLLDHLKSCLYSLTRQMVFPGSQLTIRPQIYLSVLVFTPYLFFKDKAVLVQGILVTSENVKAVMDELTEKFQRVVQNLHEYSQPIVTKWGEKNDARRKNVEFPPIPVVRPRGKKTEPFSSLPTAKDIEDELDGFSYARQEWKDEPGDTRVVECDGVLNCISLPPCEGYIHPEWSLIFMIRMAILACQMLPENTQSNIILMTDAVCGMPEPSALHDLLVQLRTLSIACSFIQVQGRVRSEPSFGHVASCELFHFLAVATFGSYMPNCKCTMVDTRVGMNSYQRQLLSWWFDKALLKNTHILSIVKEMNDMFAEMYTLDMKRHRESLLNYESSISDLVYVRLREGYTIKTMTEESDGFMIVMVLPIRPLVSIEYTISASSPLRYTRRERISAEVELVAPFTVLQELISEPTTINPCRQKSIRAYRDSIDGIVEADRILTHMHSFHSNSAYYSIPEGLSNCTIALFRGDDPPSTRMDYDESFYARPRFDKFWCQLIDVEERIWVKWTHSHEMRIILSPSYRLTHPFTIPFEGLDYSRSLNAINTYLTKKSSFCLLHKEIYVGFVNDEGAFLGSKLTSPPTHLYVIRLTGTPPFIILRVSFIGGMTNHRRVDIMRDLSEGITHVTMSQGRNENHDDSSCIVPACTLIDRPLERLLITYSSLPHDMYSIMASPSSSNSIPHITQHNALCKYLTARRVIWKLPVLFGDQGMQLPLQVASYMVEMIMKRRLSMGYEVAWMKNSIVGMIKQNERIMEESRERNDVSIASDEKRNRVEQFILFPPASVSTDDNSIRTSTIDDRHESIPTADVVIVEELWIEPNVKPDTGCNLMADEALLSSLFTLDKLLRMCAIGGNRPPVRSYTKNRETRNGTESRFVIFSLGCLLKNSQRHLVLLPFHCKETVSDGDMKRAKMTLDILHEQLADNSECTVDVQEKQKWTDICGDLEKKTEHYADINKGTAFTLYMKKTSPWSVVGVAIPSEEGKIRDWKDGALPLLFFSAEEPCVALASMQGKGGEWRVEDRRSGQNHEYEPLAQVPYDLLLSWRGHSEGGGFQPFNLCKYVRGIYETLVVKSLVTALFKAVNDGIFVSEKAVQDVTEEYCDFINLEVEGVDSALRSFCGHLQDNQMEGLQYSCANEAEFELSFSSILSKYFKPISGSPSYYHFLSQETNLPRNVNGRLLTHLLSTNRTKEQYWSDEEDSQINIDKSCKRKKNDDCCMPSRLYSLQSSQSSLSNSKVDLSELEDERYPMGEKRARFTVKETYATPLFLFFSCAVRFPNGHMETFPMNSLPSCIHHVIRRANMLPLESFKMEDVSVSLDLYVLTWPMNLEAYVDGVEGSSYTNLKKAAFLKLLPTRERLVVERLMHSIGYLIEQEMVLMDSRRREIGESRLENISRFISREIKQLKGEHDGRYEEKKRSLALVILSHEAKERIKARLDGMRIDYCKLKRCANFLYASSVVDQKRFARHFSRKSSISSTDGEIIVDVKENSKLSTIEEQEELNESEGTLVKRRVIDIDSIDLTKKDVQCDFWLIIKVTDMFHVQFCQRYAHFRHCELYEEAWRKVKRTLRTVNQQMLLEKAHESMEVNSLLLISNRERKEYGSECTSDGESDTMSVLDEDSSREQVTESARYTYQPGSFACPIVHHHWFAVPPRLSTGRLPRGGSMARKGAEPTAIDTLRQGLHTFAVTNVDNVYMFKDKKENVFYMHLHTSMESMEKTMRDVPCEIRKDVMNGMLQSHILLAVHGVDPPGEEMTIQLPCMLQKNLDCCHLDQIVRTFAKNTKAALESPDVIFIQRHVSNPSQMFHFSLPSPLYPFLNPFNFYLQQHIQEVWPNVRYREAKGRGREDSHVHSNVHNDRKISFESGWDMDEYSREGSSSLLNTNTETIHRERKSSSIEMRAKRQFEPFSCESRPKLPDSYEPRFNVVCRKREKGRMSYGFGVAEIRVITGTGCIVHIDECRISSNARLSLLGDQPLKQRFEHLTSTQCVGLPKWKRKGRENPPVQCEKDSFVVEMIVWQMGDVGKEYMVDTITCCIRQALADVVTEYAMINIRVLESLPPMSPPTKSSLINRSSIRGDDRVAFSFDPKRTSLSSERDNKEDIQKVLSPHFSSILEWFDFVVSSLGKESEESSLNCIQRLSMNSSSVEGALKVVDVMRGLMEKEVVLDEYPDTIYTAEKNGKGRFVIVKPPLFPCITEDLGVNVSSSLSHSTPSSIVLSLVPEVWDDTTRFGFDPVGLPPHSLKVLLEENKRELFGPRLPSSTDCSFIPRLRLIILSVSSTTLHLYTYNVCRPLITLLHNQLQKALDWHETRLVLLKNIGLQKMGMTHLAPQNDAPNGEGSHYVTRIWRCTQSLVDEDYPPGHYCENVPKECEARLSRLYRRVEAAFITANLYDCIMMDQLSQLSTLRQWAREEMVPHFAVSSLHHKLINGDCILTSYELTDLNLCSRSVHFVMSPLLLFAHWRSKIASIRMPEREERPRQMTERRRVSSSKMSPPARTRSTTLSASIHSSSLRRHSNEEDPCHIKVEEMLLAEYVEYLVTLGMRQFTVERDRTGRQSTSSGGQHPETQLLMAVEGGIVIASISFSPPYFHVRFSIWRMFGSIDPIDDDSERNEDHNVERAKDEIVASSHVHSFTYDFHLRMLSKYLLGRDHILFMPGYNTSAFLVDFLHYYGCRPPYARNCIYEERAQFALQHSLMADQIWAHFLQKDTTYDWRVVKMKQCDAEGKQSADFMLVQSDRDAHSERDEVKIVLHQGKNRVKNEGSNHSNQLNLLIYMLIVSRSHKTPLSDERRREDSRASEGEFRLLPSSLPPIQSIPSREDSARTLSSTNSIAIPLPEEHLQKEIDNMVTLVTEGILPSLDGERRRFSSGGHGNSSTCTLQPKQDGTEWMGSLGSLVSPSPIRNADSDNQLAIQDSAPRRHRKKSEAHSMGMMQERALYIHFLSARQRKLQKIIEDATANYRRQLQKSVSDGEWVCRRDALWQRMVAMPVERKREAHGFFSKQIPNDPWQFGRCAMCEGEGGAAKDLDTLLPVVGVSSLCEKEPLLGSLLRGISPPLLFKHLIARLGVDRCRFFEYPHSEKKCLLITNPNCLLDSAILMTCPRCNLPPTISLLLKEHDDGNEGDGEKDRSLSFRRAAIQASLHEVVSCLIAFSWSSLSIRLDVP